MFRRSKDLGNATAATSRYVITPIAVAVRNTRATIAIVKRVESRMVKSRGATA